MLEKSFCAGGALFSVLSAGVIIGHANYTFPLIIITKKPLLQLLLEKWNASLPVNHEDCSDMFSRANAKGFMNGIKVGSVKHWKTRRRARYASLHHVWETHLWTVWASNGRISWRWLITSHTHTQLQGDAGGSRGHQPGPAWPLSIRTDGSSPRNPTTTGSNGDSSASVKPATPRRERTPIKSLCSPSEGCSSSPHQCSSLGFVEKLNTPWLLSPHSLC